MYCLLFHTAAIDYSDVSPGEVNPLFGRQALEAILRHVTLPFRFSGDIWEEDWGFCIDIDCDDHSNLVGIVAYLEASESTGMAEQIDGPIEHRLIIKRNRSFMDWLKRRNILDQNDPIFEALRNAVRQAFPDVTTVELEA